MSTKKETPPSPDGRSWDQVWRDAGSGRKRSAKGVGRDLGEEWLRMTISRIKNNGDTKETLEKKKALTEIGNELTSEFDFNVYNSYRRIADDMVDMSNAADHYFISIAMAHYCLIAVSSIHYIEEMNASRELDNEKIRKDGLILHAPKDFTPDVRNILLKVQSENSIETSIKIIISRMRKFFALSVLFRLYTYIFFRESNKNDFVINKDINEVVEILNSVNTLISASPQLYAPIKPFSLDDLMPKGDALYSRIRNAFDENLKYLPEKSFRISFREYFMILAEEK